tara:strand:+ start:225 stop:698 length:474 start_codon:yes stop_codon:yes gene_type:complete
MIAQIYTYFSLEMIYLWLNIGVLPFWFVLIFFPRSKICKIFTTSVFPLLIFSSVYIYVFFIIYQSGYDFMSNFNLYMGMDRLLVLFENTSFLILFWIHFLSINLFCAGWIVNDYLKYEISKVIIFFPILITYFIGPLGLLIYWFIRIFYAKKISLYD